jgi:2-polyprenyl-3-methyl-5-hydroxy-6-metoxy-1,4-benzoquinol methylase
MDNINSRECCKREMSQTVGIKCSLCDSPHVSLIDGVSAERLVTDWQAAFGVDVGDELVGRVRIERYECRRCRLQFFVPPLPGSERLYAQMEKFEWYYSAHKWEHDVALLGLRGRGRILEIGCGDGHFITRARNERELNVEGIELNESAVNKARDNGLPVRLLELEEAAKQFPEHYDAVCAFQVLEHVANPKAFLEQCCAMIRQGGILILGLPNADSFLKHQYCLLDMPPHHATRWSKRTLSFLSNVLPLELRNIAQEPLAEYHVDEYLEAYSSHVVARYPAIQRLFRPSLKQKIRMFIKQPRVRRMLVGHTMYASFERA